MKSVQMKSALMSWAMSAVIAVCVTPGLSRVAPRGAAAHPLTLAQDDAAPMAVPGSADAQEPVGGGEPGQATPPDDSGQATPPDDPDPAQQPPVNMQQPPADDNGDDTSTQQQSGDDTYQGATPAAPSSGDEN
jgi:hypothetical protein